MGQIVMEVTGDERKILKSLRNVRKSQKEMEVGWEKVTRSSQKVAKENQKLERAAKAVWEKSKPPLRRYIDQMKMLHQAKQRGILKEHEHARALAYTKAEMRKAGDAGQRLRRNVANIGGEGRAAFGPAALTNLTKYAAGFVGIAAAVRITISALRQMNEVRQAAAGRQRESEIGLGSLGQLALGDPKKLRGLVGMARQTYKEGGAKSMDDAGRMVFSLASAGGLEHRKLFSDLRSRSLIQQPGEMAKSAKTLIQTMGEKETGGMPALVSKSFGASAYSPASAEDILAAAARSGTSAAAMGMQDESLLAATALVATAKGGAEEGGTYLAQMMRTFKQKGEFKGKALRQTLLEVDKKRQGMSPADFKEWFGRAQGQEAFEILIANLDTYDAALKDVRQAESGNIAQQVIRAADSIPELASVRAMRQAKAQRELGEQDIGTQRNLTDSIMEGTRRRGRQVAERSTHPRIVEMANTAVDWGMRGFRGLYGDEAMLGMFGGKLPEGSLRTEVQRSQLRGQVRSRGMNPESEFWESVISRIDRTNQLLEEAQSTPVGGQPRTLPIPVDLQGMTDQ